jgi:transcriptional regulator with XRE-family HTH domain
MELAELGRALRERREAIGISKAEIARRVEVSESFVAMTEQGTRRPSKIVLERWAGALGWDAVYTRQLLIMAGHLAPDQDSRPSPTLPFTGGALHFPQPKRMERERVIQELQRVLNRAEESDQGWQETVALLESFVQWLKFRLEEPLRSAVRLYLQITGPANDVQSFFNEVEDGKHPDLKVASAPRETTSMFARQTHGYEARNSGTVEFTAPVAEKLADDYVKRLIETRFPQSNIAVKVSENV